MTDRTPSVGKFKLSRRGRKLQISDDLRILVALPKDVPERTWAEILQKDENDLIVLDIREEILENALKIGYMKYMEEQSAKFTVHCATEAWMKLIDWHFYRHDPGEDPSAYPPCYIPKRQESWIPDKIPDPSPKDTWGQQNLTVVEDTQDEVMQKWPSTSSLDLPVIDEIPSEYWFPGKVNVPDSMRPAPRRGKHERPDVYDDCKISSRNSLLVQTEKSWVSNYVQETSTESQPTSEEYLNTESEVLQKITDYSTETGFSEKESSFGELKITTPVNGSLHGAGDSTVARPKRRLIGTSKSFIKPGGKSRVTLPPIESGDSRSLISIISDCRLRNLRTIVANKPDIVVIDVTIPHDGNLVKAEKDKQIKYLDLAHEVVNMWDVE